MQKTFLKEKNWVLKKKMPKFWNSFRERTAQEAGERDRNLNRRKELGGLAGEPEQALGALIALLGHALKLDLVDGQYRYLRAGKYRIQRDQNNLKQQQKPN